ncbi:MAG TPA: glycosyltransferase, partial [Rhodopila sp.]
MKPPVSAPLPDDLRDSAAARLLADFLDPDWYRLRYPDIGTSDLDPYQHFVRYGAAEGRDPNRFFDSAWYVEHYPDVGANGINPLLHYVQCGAVELRNPHPRFDAVYYVEQHPEAAPNPLQYHLRVGLARGYLTERPVDVRDYLPSELPPLPLPRGVFADVIVVACRGLERLVRCLHSVMVDRTFPLARIIVVEDASSEADLVAWLQGLADEGQIYLIRNPRPLGPLGSANRGIDAAEAHDVVLLSGEAEVPAGWLRRLAAHAYSRPNIATVSPLYDRALISGCPDNAGAPPDPPLIDQVCRTVNAARSADLLAPTPDHCLYIRRAALLAAGGFTAVQAKGAKRAANDFFKRATAAGWRHRLACDLFVSREHPDATQPRLQPRRPTPENVIPFQFAATAALLRGSGLPVILMVTHSFGGGVRRHIDALVQRYRDTARVLLLEGTDRGAALSIAAFPGQPVVTLPADRLSDLITMLRSTNLSRIHIHHLLQMDMDIRAIVQRLGVAFDVTVHDYYAICPQINLLPWPEGIYCGEPGPAACNACIADQSSHGAKDIVSWRRDRAWQFMDADRVICPSMDVKARLDRHGMGARGIVAPHEQQTEPVWFTRLPRLRGTLRIVLLGVLANHKGARAVAEVAEAADAGTMELHLIGHLEASFPRPAVKLIKTTGQYDEQDLPGLLDRIDPHVFWFPSSAAETYGYTLSTAIATGLPIVATDLGSFTERLAGRPHSWLVDHRASAKDWLAVFDDVAKTLRERPTIRSVPRPLTVSDFYTDHYLSPPPRTVSRAVRRPRIAIVPERYYSGGLTPCAYIRLLQPFDHPSVGGSFDVMLADIETIFSTDADIIVTQRHAVGNVDTANRLAAHANRIGAKLLFDLDDDLLNVPLVHPDAPTLAPFTKVVRRMLAVADAVWVSTQGLADRLEPI